MLQLLIYCNATSVTTDIFNDNKEIFDLIFEILLGEEIRIVKQDRKA